MVNYGKGKIYRIVCNQTGFQYIGSTTISLSARLSQHKKLFKNNISGSSKVVLENNDYNIILIEDYPCERKEQLLARERFHIENSHCVNKNIPLRTQAEWYKDNKDRLIKNQIMWNNANREKCMEYQSRFRNKNKGIVVNLNGEEDTNGLGVALGEVDYPIKLVIEDLYDGNILESAEDIYKYIEEKFN